MDARKRRTKFGGENKSEKPGKSAKKTTYQKQSEKRFSSVTLFLLFVVFVVFCFVVGYYTSPITALPYDGWKNVPLSGKFKINNKLNNGIRISLNAPESIEVDIQGNLYAGLQDGRIVKIYPSHDGAIGLGKSENVTNGVFEGATTIGGNAVGRPMGIRVRGDVLYAMDAAYGFYKVDLKSKKPSFLVPADGLSPPMKFPNDVDITSDGRYAYFTDSSSLWSFKDAADIALLDGTCTGRLVRYEFSTKELVVVAKDFCFNNGLQLSKDEKTLLMAETARIRALIIDLKSGKTIKIIPLPMLPDNIRMSRRGTYLLTGSNVPTFLGQFGVQQPVLRQAIAGCMPKALITLSMPLMFNMKYNIVVEIDQSGEVLRTLQDPTGSVVVGASQVTELNDGRLVVGSYFGPNAAIVTI